MEERNRLLIGKLPMKSLKCLDLWLAGGNNAVVVLRTGPLLTAAQEVQQTFELVLSSAWAIVAP